MSSAQDDLSERFKQEAGERYSRILELLNGVTAGVDSATACSSIREEAHKIKGAAGMLGFPETRDHAAELEVAATRQAAAADPDGAAAHAALAPAVAALKSALP